MSVHTRRGSTVPAATFVQRPSAPAMAQLRHPPAHSVLQQIPGPVAVSRTQCWFRQSAFAVQGWPSTFGPQLLLTQATPSAQSAAVVHRALHLPLAQRYVPQVANSARRQVPRPSHVRSPFMAVVPEHVGAPQGVSAG